MISREESVHRRIEAGAEGFEPISAGALLRRLLYGATIALATQPLIFRTLTFWVFRLGLLHDLDIINRRTRNDPQPVRRERLPAQQRVRMSPAQARRVLAQLPRVDADTQRRTEIAKLYRRELEGVAGVSLPPLGADGADGFLVFPIEVEDREALLRHLMKVGRDCASHYYRNTAELECFADLARDCPNARRAAETTVLLPTYPRYGFAEARKNTAAIRDFFARRG